MRLSPLFAKSLEFTPEADLITLKTLLLFYSRRVIVHFPYFDFTKKVLSVFLDSLSIDLFMLHLLEIH